MPGLEIKKYFNDNFPRTPDEYARVLTRARVRILLVATNFIIFFLILIFKILFAGLPYAYKAASKFFNSSVLQLITFGLAACLGVVLFRLRKYDLRFYAILEIAFSLVTAWHTSFSTSGFSNLSSLLPFFASVYLLVRGLSNYSDSKESRIIAMVFKEKD